MIIQRAVRYRLEPTPEQENLLARAAGCVRFVWNRALSVQKSYLDHQCGILTYPEMCHLLTSWRNSAAFGFLAESSSSPQQQTLKHLASALKNAFDKTSAKKFPQPKKKFRHDSLRYPNPDHVKIDLNTLDQDGRNALPRIFLPKIGWVKFRKSRVIGGEVRNVTVRREGGHWFVSIQTEKTISDPVHPSTTAAGGDRGVANLLTLSDGTVFFPVTAYRDLQSKLAKAQRKLAHKVKFSANWKVQKATIARLQRRIAEMRKTILHQVSAVISKNHAVVVLEHLKVGNMTGSARGTVEAPGRNIRQKSGLNKSILDQGWDLLKRMLGYKLRWSGGMLLLVDPAYTSQTCSACGYVDAGNRTDQKTFHCLHCGHEAHADVNAARNILARGMLPAGELKSTDELQSTAGHAGVACFAA